MSESALDTVRLLDIPDTCMAEKKVIIREESQSHAPGPSTRPQEALRIEKVNVTVTLVSEGGRRTDLTLSGADGILPANGKTARSDAPESFEATELLRVRSGAPLREVEDAYIRLVLGQTGNQKRAAKILGISPHTLSNRLRNGGGRKIKSGVEQA